MKNQFDKETIICLLILLIAVLFGVFLDEAEVNAGKSFDSRRETCPTSRPETSFSAKFEKRSEAKKTKKADKQITPSGSAKKQPRTVQTTVASKKASVTTAQTTAPSQTTKADKKSDKKGDPLSKQAGITVIDGIKIVNKSHPLPADYNPGLTEETVAAYKKLQAAMQAEGLSCFIVSGFRSYSTQVSIYNNFVAMYGQAEADRISARPGFSEHQLGEVFDVNSLEQSFGQTPEGIWIHDHCWEYGFIVRYPLGKEKITGYSYEPWHLRYVGPELAAKLYNGGDWITLEEHFGITSSYAD